MAYQAEMVRPASRGLLFHRGDHLSIFASIKRLLIPPLLLKTVPFLHFSVELCVAFLLVLRTLHLVGMSAGLWGVNHNCFLSTRRNRGKMSVVSVPLAGTGLPEPSS